LAHRKQDEGSEESKLGDRRGGSVLEKKKKNGCGEGPGGFKHGDKETKEKKVGPTKSKGGWKSK